MKKKDFAILFWGPNSCGYRYNVNDAGIYTEDEIKSFDEDHYCDDMPILKNVVDDLLVDMVIDNNKLGKVCLNNRKNRKLLRIKLDELRKGESNWDSGAFCEPKKFLHFNQKILNVVNEIKTLENCS